VSDWEVGIKRGGESGYGGQVTCPELAWVSTAAAAETLLMLRSVSEPPVSP